MRIAFAVLGVLVIVGCSHSMTAPDPLTSSRTKLWGMVIEESGVCLVGGAVAVVGQTGGASQVQETPCDVWGYGGGFVLRDLQAGVLVTLRVSAPGYETRDVSVIPSLSQGTVFEVVLAKSD